MGVLSIYFKSSFLGLLKFMNSINWFIVFFSLINLSVCIYEDQIGKFDWRQTYVGRIKFAQFDTVSTAKKIIVATEENVLAALNLKTGQVVWRHVFESTSSGNIQLLHFTDKVVTVTGSNPYLVRGWDSATGVLLWEWSLTLNNDKAAEFSEWWVQQGLLVHMLPIFGSHIEVTTYNLLTGQNRGVTSKLPAIWTNAGCVLSPPYYSCVSGNDGSELLLSLDVTSNAIQIITKPLSNYINGSSFEGNLRLLSGNSAVPGFIVDDKKVVLIVNNEFQVASAEVADSSASVSVIVDGSSDKIMIQTWDDDIKGFALIAHNVVTGQEVSEIQCFDRDLELPEPELNAVMCTKSAKNQHICRLVITGADDSLHLMQQEGRVLWTREEALANVVAAEFVDLPVSELDAAIESEFDQKEGSIWAAFSRRVHTQLQQLHTLLLSLHQTDSSRQDSSTPLVRDYFNLHKIVVLVTDVGKIFGMDNLSGAIVWSRYESSLDAENVLIFNRRSAHHLPHDAYISILGKQAENGNGLVLSLNPISGSLVGERVLPLDVQVVQAALLHVEDQDRLHALLLLDTDETVQILPVSAAPLVQNMFMYVAERDTGKVKGYALRYDGKSVVAQRTWTVELGGGASGTGTRVVAAATRTGGSYSPGKALGDRSVLYKYDNPNMVLFITQGPDPLHKDVVTAVVVDAVSGAVVAAQTHRRATATKHAIHADNFFAYVYYNDKHRRTEIATLEVYEGKQRWSSGGAFSSLGSALAPGAERRAYVAGGAGSVRAAAVSRTGRDLTERHLLLALAGGVAEVPWAALEATPGPASSPDVPLPAEAVLSYNHTLHRLNALHVAPSGLESTCLVLATGLDLFYTRVAPSKTFDLLKDDFDYYLITIVLTALVVASYATKYFASRKMLRQAWK